MCGIVGYIGNRSAVPILIDGLRRLEYRGYDSSGIAVIEKGKLVVEKKQGKLSVLDDMVKDMDWTATVGIGHTRWATHGKPSDENAHPHVDCTGKFAIIHNGIIENYLDLKENLIKRGHIMKSETDTETMVHLIEELYDGDLETAVIEAVKKAQGAYALVVVSEHEPDKIVAVRKTSPMIVGLGEGEYFIASDIPAILPHTRKAFIMNDGEMVVVTRNGAVVKDFAGKVIEKEIFEVNWDIAAAEKGGYSHFMLKEIFEQPDAFSKTMLGRVKDGEIVFPELEEMIPLVKNIRTVHLIACGTAYHAGMVGKYAIEKLARISAYADVASEFRYRDPIIQPGDIAVVISQSGETADTLAGLREAKAKGAKIVAVTNVVGSSVAREADYVLYTWAGPEIAVASTKAYSTQVLIMLMFSIWLAAKKGGQSKAEALKSLVNGLADIPAKADKLLDQAEVIENLAKKYSKSEDAFFIGRGLDYAVALEGQLKLKEISYIHAEAYAAGELKHGALALIEEGVPVVALVTQKHLYDKTLSNVQEVLARGATIIAVARQSDDEIKKSATDVIRIPDCDDLLMPLLTVIPLQLLSYYIAVARGCDVDQPRNLAKSVTVE